MQLSCIFEKKVLTPFLNIDTQISCVFEKKKNLPSKVSHELQLTDFSLSGNPNLQEVSCVLG
jgi:hypothetical protein